MSKKANTSLFQLTLMRMREFIREPEALFWASSSPSLWLPDWALPFATSLRRF
jgi:hypothetical protein